MNPFESTDKTIQLAYSIADEDYLIHQLYIASESDLIKKKRRNSRVTFTLIYILGAVFLFTQELEGLSIVFLVIGILWYSLFPLYERKRYLKHYQEFIKENYKDRFKGKFSLEISSSVIVAADGVNDSRTKATEITEIVELPTLILIRLRGGHSFILPKSEFNDLEKLKSDLISLANTLEISYINQQKWFWK